MKAVAVIGPTASGKSGLAMEMAMRIGGEIVSIDSRQIYRRLDIGTAKPSADDMKKVPHHLIDILDIDRGSDANWFAGLARTAIDNINSRGSTPVLAGGSGLYLRAVLEGFFNIELDPEERSRFAERIEGKGTEDLYGLLCSLDPESSERIHPNDRYRIIRAIEVYELSGTTLSKHFRRHRDRVASGSKPDILKIGLDMDREKLHARINIRTEEMFARGWADEVRDILDSGAVRAWPGLQTLGYPEVISYLDGKAGKEDTVEEISAKTRQYAKRQLTWFRKEKDVKWLEADDRSIMDAAMNLLDSWRTNC